MAPCIVCDNQVSRHYFAAAGAMIVSLCKQHQANYGELVEVIPANDTCPRCSHFGQCCKTRVPEVSK